MDDNQPAAKTPYTGVITPEDSILTMGSPNPKYHQVRYAYDDFFEGGALREGGAPKIFSKDYIGLVAQYAGVGLVLGLLPNVIYPFLQNYLNISGAQTTTALTLVNLPWSFKIFYGILSDCFPVFGYRRRPYMVLGWAICVGSMFAMAFSPVDKPYFSNPAYRSVKPENYTDEIEATLNRHAATQGWKYIIPMMSAAFGELMADVCADGLLVELAQREPANVRGTTQTIIYATRTFFSMAALVAVAFLFNGTEYGGTYDFTLSFPALMLVFSIVLSPLVPISWFFIKEERALRVNLGEYLNTLWEIVQTRAVYQVIAYMFFSGIFASFTYTAANPIQTYWVGVTTMHDKIAGFCKYCVLGLSIWATGRYGLQWSWRTVPIVTSVGFVVLDAFGVLITVWDVKRAQWYWLMFPVLEQIPTGVAFIVSTFIIIELSTEGHEGAMYGLLSTVRNLATPFSTALTRNVDSVFDLTTERIQNDSTGVRRDITIAVLIMYVVHIGSLAWLVLLPRQKEETQLLKRLGGSSRFMGMFTVAYLWFALIWAVMTNIMSIFPSTACLTIAGGSGC